MASQGSLVEIVQSLSAWRLEVALGLLALPVLTYALGTLLARTANRSLTGGFLAVTVYAAVLPGIPMTLVVAYLLFFARKNLLTEVDAVLFLGPVVCMVLTLAAAWKVLPMCEIPGFGRLRGLMFLTAIAFGATYLLYQLRVYALFLGSFTALVVVFVLLFLGFKAASAKLVGRD